MFVWGKAYIAGQTLGLRPMTPAFGLNARGYGRYFRTSRADWLLHRALRASLPGATFGEAHFRANEQLGFAHALKVFAAEQRLERHPLYTLGLEGMWGGLEAVRPARDFLFNKLMSSRWTLENLFQLDRRLPADTLTIGFHIRRGDFGRVHDSQEFRGKFNVPIPLKWYVAVARTLRAWFNDHVSFLAVSDAPRGELAPFGTEIPCVFTDDLNNRDISDLLSLARCDLVVCSISSYSLWAAFFSSGRYVWFEPNLTEEDGYASIWGHEATQKAHDGLTARAREVMQNADTPRLIAPRGVASGWDGSLPENLRISLEDRRAAKTRASDLIRYGVLSRSWTL
jgi:hypothetical protein